MANPKPFNLPIIFQGRGDFNLTVDGELDNPQLDLDISLGQGQIDSLSFDHLELHGSFSAGIGYRLDRFTNGNRLMGFFRVAGADYQSGLR